MYTKNELIELAKQSEAGILGTHVPHVPVFFGEFADKIGLNHDEYYHIQKYIKNVSYAAKKHVFESLGFDVLFLTLSAMKVSRFLSDGKNKFASIDQEFLDGKRNVFIFEVEQGMGDNLYFVLEYPINADPSDDPDVVITKDALCDYTVDREELAREEERKAQVAGVFSFLRKNRDEKSDDGGLF